jgi:hypothetical protein
VVIFDADSSLGIVRLFYENLEREVAALAQFQQESDRADRSNFEHDLEAGLKYTSPDEASEV